MSENLENYSKKKRNAYVTAMQKEKLIDFITSNYGVMYGNESSIDGALTKDELWNQISAELNAIGVIKDVAGWKRCYASMKCSTNRKVKNCSDVDVPKGLNSSQLKIISASQSNPRNVLGTKNSTTSGQRKAVNTSDAIITGTYATPLQRKQLVDLVSSNYDALYGKLSNSANGASIKKTVWKSIASQLNTVGPNKDADGWMRCFTGLKGTTKEKLSEIRQNMNRNGGRKIELDPLQQELHKMHPPDALDGCQKIDELGLGKHTASNADITVFEEEDDLIDVFTSTEPNLSSMKTDYEHMSRYLADLQKNAILIDKKSTALLKKVTGSEEASKLEVEALADDTQTKFQPTDNREGHENEASNTDNNDTSGATVRDLSKYEAIQRAFLTSATPAIDGHFVDFNDLNEEEQMALLLNGQFEKLAEMSESDLDVAVAAAAVRIEDMEMDIELNEPTADVQVDDGKTKIQLEDEEQNLIGTKVVILENVVISEARNSPSEQIETNIQVPIVPINAPTQPGVNISSDAPTQQQPQRRGVEINLNKYADTRQEVNAKDKNNNRGPRRNRLSTPLGVMAQRALEQQIKTNDLLAEILSELRGQRNKQK